MHTAAVALLILAGLCFCAAGIQRWRNLGATTNGGGGLSWMAMGLLTVGVILSLIDGQHLRFLVASVSAWAAAAAALFLTGFLRRPGPTLFALPAGGLALFGAALALLDRPTEDGGSLAVASLMHVLLMAGHTAAMLVAGTAAGLYLLAARQLKQADGRSLSLPSLPFSARVCDLSLAVAASLLIGGLAIGGVAMPANPDFDIWTPLPLLAGINLVLLVLLLAAVKAQVWSRRHLSWATLAMLLVVAFTLVVLFLDRAHG